MLSKTGTPLFRAISFTYRSADKSLARPGTKQARKHVGDARDSNNIETRTVINFFFLQVKAPKEIHVILTETVTCFIPRRAKNLSAPLYKPINDCIVYSQIRILRGTQPTVTKIYIIFNIKNNMAQKYAVLGGEKPLT